MWTTWEHLILEVQRRSLYRPGWFTAKMQRSFKALALFPGVVLAFFSRKQRNAGNYTLSMWASFLLL